jgi:transcriptional regulator with XRE-family HTH domain
MTNSRARQVRELVGSNIRAGRTAKGMTQAELGAAIGGVSGPDISRWEAGRVEPSADARAKLADILFGGDLAALYQRNGTG